MISLCITVCNVPNRSVDWQQMTSVATLPFKEVDQSHRLDCKPSIVDGP